MTKARNFWTAALEEQVPDTITVDKFAQVDTLQPKPGTGECPTGEPSLDDTKVDKEFGEEALIAEHDEIDTVAESQEHTLALEHLQSATMRFCRMAAALEEIAETAEASLEPVEAGEGAPASDGEGLTPETVTLLTTALDAGGVGEPLAESVALEAFGFDRRIATEGFVDTLKDRAEKVWAAAAKFAKKAFELTGEKLKRFADYFRKLENIYVKLEKDGEALAGHSGKPFQNSKWEKKVQERFYAPASTKTPIAAVDNAISEFNEVLKIVHRLSNDMTSMTQAWAGDEPGRVVTAMNNALSTSRGLAEMGRTKFKHSSLRTEVNLPEKVTLDDTGGLTGTKVTYAEGETDLSAGIKIASMEDIKHLKASAAKAERAITVGMEALFDIEPTGSPKSRASSKEEDKVVVRKLLTKYTNLMRLFTDLIAGTVFGAGHGMYFNHFGATRWVRFSIAEAKAAVREAK